MNKTAVILPYFGKFNNYFEKWLKSCEYNNKIDWLIYTDDKSIQRYPTNVKVTYTTLQDIKLKIEKIIGKKIYLDIPYKLCDFRPLYGMIFREDVKNYEFWGWCDCDAIWGDILEVLPSDVWENYDKIFDRGHLSFVRNTDEINKCIINYERLRTIITGKPIYAWDEIYDGYYKGVNQILIENGYKVFNGRRYAADIDYREKGFRIIEEDEYNSIFYYDHGKLYKISYDGDKINEKTEIAYIHFQKRKMTNETDDCDKYYMIPNKFISNINVIDVNYIKKVNKIEKGYFDIQADLKWYRHRQLQRILHEPHKIASLIYVLRRRMKGE